MFGTLAIILGICFGVIFVLFVAATLIWVVFFKAIKGTSKNIKDTVALIKEPKKKISEVHTYYEEGGIKKERVEVMK